jgi:hypothetical protein
MQKCKIWTNHPRKFQVYAGQQNSKFGGKENRNDLKNTQQVVWSQEHVQWTHQGKLIELKQSPWVEATQCKDTGAGEGNQTGWRRNII